MGACRQRPVADLERSTGLGSGRERPQIAKAGDLGEDVGQLGRNLIHHGRFGAERVGRANLGLGVRDSLSQLGEKILEKLRNA